MSQTTASIARGRPNVTVYWQPGCSSCLKAKEFVTDHVLDFESVNVLEDADAMREVMAAGLRSIPAVRKGERFVYAQSLDDIAALLGVSRNHVRLSNDLLAQRWDAVLEVTKDIVSLFDQGMLARPVILGRSRTISELSAHVYQVAESFLRQVEDDTIDARAIYMAQLEGVDTPAGLLSYIEGIRADYRRWMHGGGVAALPKTLRTHYGVQPAAQVLERGVWHSTQHARQLDHVAAGMGAELRMPQTLYDGLPLPKRLWA
jgi:glutaredoxin